MELRDVVTDKRTEVIGSTLNPPNGSAAACEKRLTIDIESVPDVIPGRPHPGEFFPDLTVGAALDVDEQQRAAAGLALLNEYDGKIKKLLTGIFGAENDFDAILGGVNLAGVGANGKRVVQNLLEALTPILREGAERRLTAAADAAAARADAARAERGAV